MEKQKTQNSQNNIEREEKLGGDIQLHFKTCCKVIVSKLV